jgi:hypothetical protein
MSENLIVEKSEEIVESNQLKSDNVEVIERTEEKTDSAPQTKGEMVKSDLEEIKTNTVKNNYVTIPPIDLKYFDVKNFFSNQTFQLNGKFLNYLKVLTSKLDKRKFSGYFNKTLDIFVEFKKDENFNDVADYFRRCQFLHILQLMAMITNSLPQFGNSDGLFKVCPSKDGEKKCCIIDDSTIMDPETKEVRSTKGTNAEPHRGCNLFNKLIVQKKIHTINTFHDNLVHFENILKKIESSEYVLFDPINVLQRIVRYLESKKMYNVITILSWEIHDSPYLLSNVEKVKLFQDYDKLKKLWETNFITDNQGKFRIFVLSFYYMDLLYRNEIKEQF